MKQTVICDGCGSAFERESREITRSQKLGRKQYCTRSCAGGHNMEHLVAYQQINAKYLVPGSEKDEYSGHREGLRRIKMRQGDTDVTLEHLKEIWDEQQGICPYSGVALSLPTGKGRHDPTITASLDRKDSTKPYEVGNLQYVSTAINWMKNSMTHEQTVGFINLLRRRQG